VGAALLSLPIPDSNAATLVCSRFGTAEFLSLKGSTPDNQI
jgi:hypothetical protein